MICKDPALKHLVGSKDKAARQINVKRQHVRGCQTAAERGRARQAHHVVSAVRRTAVDRIKSKQLKVEIQAARRNHLRRCEDARTVSRLDQTRSTDRSDCARSTQLGPRRHRYRPRGVQRPVHHQLARIHRRGSVKGALPVQRGGSRPLLRKSARTLDDPVILGIRRTPNRQISVPQLDRSPNPVHRSKFLTLPIQVENGPSRLNHGTRRVKRSSPRQLQLSALQLDIPGEGVGGRNRGRC